MGRNPAGHRGGRRQAMLLVALLVALGAAGSYWLWQARETAREANAAPGPEPAAFAVPVEAAPVRLDTVVRTIRAVGSLRSDESVVITSEIAGRIAEILVAEGQAVARGTPLVVLDSSIYEAELAQAEARLALSRANYARARELKEKGAGTARALDEALAELRNDEAAVALARARLEKTVIAAPFDGVLGLRRVSVGSYLSPGDEIVNLEAIDPLKVDVRIPERFLSAVRVGQELAVELDAFPDESFPGTVYAIDPLIDAEGRSILVRALLPNAAGRLRPGLFARVALVVERQENAMLVPERALVPFGDDQFVFRVVEGKAAMTPVTLGERQGDEVKILDGLSPDDLIITDGLMKIRDGAPVTVVEPPANGAGAG